MRIEPWWTYEDEWPTFAPKPDAITGRLEVSRWRWLAYRASRRVFAWANRSLLKVWAEQAPDHFAGEIHEKAFTDAPKALRFP